MNEDTEVVNRTRRISFEEKLKMLGISDRECQSFFKLFVQDPQCYLMKKEGEGWQVATKAGRFQRLDKNVVASHLMQEYCVATLAPRTPLYLCVAVGGAKKFSWAYNTVRDWIPRSLVILASGGGGVQIYAFIDPEFPIGTDKLYSVVSMELKIRGIETPPGTCEIFPAPNRFLRLPLGKGSCLLDPKTLTPMNLNVRESIKFINQNLWRHGFEELFPGLYSKIGQPKPNHRIVW